MITIRLPFVAEIVPCSYLRVLMEYLGNHMLFQCFVWLLVEMVSFFRVRMVVLASRSNHRAITIAASYETSLVYWSAFVTLS
jgi:hypothetical protein